MERAVIVGVGRSAVGRAIKGSLTHTRMDDLAAEIIRSVLGKISNFPKEEIEDVIIGCAMPEAEQGLNVARNISFLAGLPLSAAGTTINRFCGSSLETIHIAANAIMSGNGEVFITGGIETMTNVPMGGYNPSFNSKLCSDKFPDAYIAMGRTAENLAEKYSISREAQDKFALHSHQKAVKATTDGLFDSEVVPVKVGKPGKEVLFSKDESVREDTSLEKLAGLKPAFKKDGTVTAGNSSPLSDGAAAVIIMSETKAKALKIKPLARIIGMGVAGVDPSVMGLGPVFAVPKALKRAGLNLNDMDLIELNEAFAAQSLSVIKELNIDLDKLNVNGGAIAIGHPLGCSGARIMTTLVNAMAKREASLGLATMCIGGGQGIATVIEKV